jgi:cell division protein FtsL
VIAQKAIQQPPRVAVRARDAARRRVRRTRLNGYAMLARIAVTFAVLLVPVMVYVMLMANLTGMNYALAHETQRKLALQEETTRLDEQIGQLRSRDRLADLAEKLRMHDPRTYAVVDLPRPVVVPPPNGIAFLGAFFHH